MHYDDFLRTITDTYVRAKKTENELRSEKMSVKFQTQKFYEGIIEEIKAENEKHIQNLENTLKECYEKKLKTEIELLKQTGEIK